MVPGPGWCRKLRHPYTSLLPGPLGGCLHPGPEPGSSVAVHCSSATSRPCAASQSVTRGSLKPSLCFLCQDPWWRLLVGPASAAGLLSDQTLRNSSSVSYSWSLYWAGENMLGHLGLLPPVVTCPCHCLTPDSMPSFHRAVFTL